MLFFKGAFFRYGRKFAEHRTSLSNKFELPSEMKALRNPEIIVDDRVMRDFMVYLEESHIEFEKEEFEEAKEEIRRELTREIFSSLWGMEEGVKVYRKTDPVVLKAIEVLPEAKRLLTD